MNKKLRLGFFSFSCSQDNTIIFLEILNEKYFEWKDKIDIVYSKALKKNNQFDDLDLAFIEGAIATKEDEKELKIIRKKVKYLVPIGSCAVNGGPAASRNTFPKSLKKEIQSILKKYKLYTKVKSVPEVVKIDDKVDGCPMDENKFIEIMEKYIKKCTRLT